MGHRPLDRWTVRFRQVELRAPLWSRAPQPWVGSGSLRRPRVSFNPAYILRSGLGLPVGCSPAPVSYFEDFPLLGEFEPDL